MQCKGLPRLIPFGAMLHGFFGSRPSQLRQSGRNRSAEMMQISTQRVLGSRPGVRRAFPFMRVAVGVRGFRVQASLIRRNIRITGTGFH